MSKGFGLEAQLREINERLKRMETEQQQMRQEQQQFMSEVREFMTDTTAKLNFLIAELSRFKNDSDELLVSAFAYFTTRGLKFTYGTLAAFGKLATRYSKRHGYQIEQTQDPRFGFVNLYEPEVLDALIEQQTNEED